MKKNSSESNNTFSVSLFAPVVTVIFVDQISKAIAATNETHIIKNTGGTFGIFAENNTLFLLVAVGILGAVVLYAYKQKHILLKNRIFRIAFLLILGGGISNSIDRLFRGYVVDFISVPLWPHFNIADLCITLGVTLLLWYTFFVPQEEINNG